MKLFNIHIPKTAGQYLLKYLDNKLNYRILCTFDLDELKKFQNEQGDVVVTSESLLPKEYGWGEAITVHKPEDTHKTIEIIKNFKSCGFFSFVFVRDPREVLCSLYRYCWDRQDRLDSTKQVKMADIWRKTHHGIMAHKTLDSFLISTNLRSVPSFWEELDFTAEFNVKNMTRLVEIIGDKYQPEIPINTSTNKGYKFYCDNGEISLKSQEKLDNSIDLKIFREIQNRYN